ncbi:MAG: biotin transporter BioY [Agathobacter sp.]|nr:biotin transporter BioY [Agathobacter sp.]
MNTTLKTKNLTKIALCVAILCVTSFLVVPLPFTPIVISMHTIVVNLIGLILKPKEAGITILMYLLMGLIGLPVFSAGTAGPAKLFGPTGGFYFGFLFAVIAISQLRGKKNSFARYCLVSILVGMPIQHICAMIVMCLHNGGNVSAAFATVSLPFILGDIIKCVMASMVGVALNKVLN